MKKIRILSLALVALTALSAFVASAASAEVTLLAEWLIKEKAVLTLTSVEIVGTIILINKAGVGGTPKIECLGSLDGSVGPDGEDEVTEVLDEFGNLVSTTPLTGNFNDCLTINSTLGCGATGSLAEVWGENLPWLSLLFLMADNSFLDHLSVGTPEATALPGYDVHCVATGTDNLCEELATAVMENMPGENDVLGKFVAGSEVATCTIGTGELEGEGLVITLNGEPIEVSSV